MGVRELQVRGFRSLKDVSWSPGNLNVLIGPNGAGKSNLLRTLSFLQRAGKGELPQAVLEQGGISPLLWDGKVSEIALVLKHDAGVKPGLPGGMLTYELALRQLGGTSAYRIEREALANYHLVNLGQKSQPFYFLERFPGHAVTFEYEERSLLAHEGSVPDDQTLLSLVAGPFGNRIILEFRDFLASWGIYHDVQVHQQSPVRQAAVARLERQVSPDGTNLIPVLHTLYSGDRDFKKTIDSSMRAAFGEDYEEIVFPPAADQRIQLRVRWRSLRTEQSAADLSDGTIRFLLLIAVFASPNPGGLIAVDEPEVGLHPSMFPIVAELAREASRRTQVVLTTHSPQFLDAFREPPTTTVMKWEGGQAVMATINGDELRRWLKEFSLGSLFRSGELEQLV